MQAWEQIQESIEWIEHHLSEEISIEELAKIAALSPFYYQRLFGRLVKKPVAEYVKLRRMAKATELLQQKNRRILDIALELGFSSHQYFSRTFKSIFGMTPEDYRKCPGILNCMTKPELLLNYIVIDEGVPLITNGMVLEISRRTLEEPVLFAGLKMDMPVTFIDGLGIESGKNPLDTLWRTFHLEKEEALGLEKNSEEIGVTYPCDREGFFSYFAGGRFNPKANLLPSNYTSWELPPGEYVVCSFEAENFELLVKDALYKAEQYMYGVWLPGHHLQSEPFCAERYTDNGDLPEITSMEVWLKI